MKLKKTLKLGLISLTLAQPLLAPMARAEDAREAGGGVGFRRGGGLTGPVHPGPGIYVRQPVQPLPSIRDGPEQPSLPEGSGGGLTLDFVSTFTFETNKAVRENDIYYAQPQHLRDARGQPIMTPNFVQVTDQRGTAEGWTLNLQKTTRFYDENRQPLRGTGLSLKNAVVVAANPGNQPRAPSTLDKGTGPTEIIAQADPGSGTGTTTVRWGTSLVETQLHSENGEQRTAYLNHDVQLFAPGGKQRQNYTYQAILTWILSEVPSNE
ncbi:WxL domain-containing protein [Lactococcus formosensis]|uniref:WxL domain-containing protein n=1 Tax=Lactococcus formosensis TaxID=1281486 RepID=UPI0022E876D8|nr:WxL domain-containing protein [Lactococcus formosensis]